MLFRSLAAPGPEFVPEPEHLEGYAHGVQGPDVEVAYALLAFAHTGPSDASRDRELSRLDAELPAPVATGKAKARAEAAVPDAPYLELTLAELPEIAKPKVQPKRLSTGQAPLEIARIGSEWRISCTGCGEASRLVQFRWQALEETVACRCD